MAQKPKMWDNFKKTQKLTKLSNSKCAKTQKFNWAEVKKFKCDKTKKIERKDLKKKWKKKCDKTKKKIFCGKTVMLELQKKSNWEKSKT